MFWPSKSSQITHWALLTASSGFSGWHLQTYLLSSSKPVSDASNPHSHRQSQQQSQFSSSNFLYWSLSCHWNKTSNVFNLKEERPNFIHIFIGFSPLSTGYKTKIGWWKGIVEESCLPSGIQEQRVRKKEPRAQVTTPVTSFRQLPPPKTLGRHFSSESQHYLITFWLYAHFSSNTECPSQKQLLHNSILS